MAGFYSQDFIDQVRESVAIEDVLSDYVTFKRKGASLWAVCPFHNEKTPSFHVQPELGFYKCFSCGRGGNVFTFLMEMEGLSFPEAVRLVAERTGIPLPETSQDEGQKQSVSERDQLFNALERAAKWFHYRLTGKIGFDSKAPSVPSISADAQKALDYLHDRGITNEIINDYRLGWAESGWDHLVTAAAKSGIPGIILEKVGLSLKKRDGIGYVDRFRARVIFPIFNLSGKAVAFGARRIDGITPAEDEAKYINTSENQIYHKGNNLYGLYTSRDTIRKAGFTYLVEGYTDLLAFVQAGVRNVVASLGTSLTQDQINLAARFANRIHIVYDSDAAGINATIRASDMITRSGLEARVVTLPAGEDPDSLLRSGGRDALVSALDHAQTMIEFRLSTAGYSSEMGQSERIQVVRSILETVRGVSDPLRNEVLITELASLSGLNRNTLETTMAGIRRNEAASSATDPIKLIFSSEQIVERDLMTALLAKTEIIPEFMDKLSKEFFTSQPMRTLYLELEQYYLQDEDIVPSSLPDKFDNLGLRSFIATCVFDQEESTADQARESVRHCLNRMKLREQLKLKQELELKLSEAVKNKQSYRELMQKLVEVQKEISQTKE